MFLTELLLISARQQTLQSVPQYRTTALLEQITESGREKQMPYLPVGGQ